LKKANKFSKDYVCFLIAPGGKVAAHPKGKKAEEAMKALSGFMKEKGAIKAPATSPEDMGIKCTKAKVATHSHAKAKAASSKKVDKIVDSVSPSPKRSASHPGTGHKHDPAAAPHTHKPKMSRSAPKHTVGGKGSTPKPTMSRSAPVP